MWRLTGIYSLKNNQYIGLKANVNLFETNKEKTMKVIIFGSTGGTGRQIVTQALEQGHEVLFEFLNRFD